MRVNSCGRSMYLDSRIWDVSSISAIINFYCLTLNKCLFLMFSFEGMIFLAVQLLISNSVISAQVLLHKPLDETISINCTGCNSSSCLININNVDLHYNVSDNGMLTLPPNDLTVYGTIICNGSNEQKEYLICPPNIGTYV